MTEIIQKSLNKFFRIKKKSNEQNRILIPKLATERKRKSVQFKGKIRFRTRQIFVKKNVSKEKNNNNRPK